MEYNVDIFCGDEKIFTLYNIHKFNPLCNNEEIYNIKKNKVVELLQQPVFFQLYNSLKKIYNDNFDIQLYDFFVSYTDVDYLLGENFVFDFIIKFDEINITNSRSHKGLLKDMFVNFQMLFLKNNTCCFKYSSIEGVRSTMYDFEVQSGYIHSHLSSRQRQVPTFNGFCLGNGPIKLVLIELCNPVKFNIIKFEGFLHQLKNYLSWESIEGGPYIRLQNRMQKQGSILPTHFYCFHRINNEADIMIKKLNENINLLLNFVKISLSLDRKDIVLNITISDEENIVNLIKKIKHDSIQDSDLFAIKTEDGYTRIDSDNKNFRLKNLENANMFMFRNNIITFKIIYENKEQESYEKIVLNPIFKQKMLNYIKYLIKQKIQNDSNQERGEFSDKKENEYYRFKKQEDTAIYL